MYIESLRLDGDEYTKNYVKHGDLLKGGVLKFDMGNKPNLQRGIHPEDYPYSFSNEIKKK
jgi:putative alpha-1,2-mannosidase